MAVHQALVAVGSGSKMLELDQPQREECYTWEEEVEEA